MISGFGEISFCRIQFINCSFGLHINSCFKLGFRIFLCQFVNTQLRNYKTDCTNLHTCTDLIQYENTLKTLQMAHLRKHLI